MLVEELIGTADEQCEHMVLSQILSSRMMVLDLEPEYFTGLNRTLFEALLRQWNAHGQILPELLPAGLLGASERVLEVRGASGKQVLARLQSCFLSRSQGLLMAEALKISDPTEAMTAMEGYISEALYSHKSTTYDHTEELKMLVAAIDRGVRDKLTVVGYPSGVSAYDRLTNGFESGKTYVVGALKKTGKSRWMVQSAIEAARAGAGVLVNSLEMSPLRLNQLALSYFSAVNSAKIGRSMVKRELEAVLGACDELSKLKWRIYRDHTVAAMRSRIIYARTSAPVDVVFVDFIQRMRDDGYKGDRTREVERVSQDISDMARSLGVAVVVLTQLKGEAEHVGQKGNRQQTADDMPNMSHVKESQGIVENADVITILHNPTRHESAVKQDGTYIPQTILCKVEQRDDISGNVIRLTADLRTCRFTCTAYDSGLPSNQSDAAPAESSRERTGRWGDQQDA